VSSSSSKSTTAAATTSKADRQSMEDAIQEAMDVEPRKFRDTQAA
jgi:hypothetical protein